MGNQTDVRSVDIPLSKIMNDIEATATTERTFGELSQRLREQRPIFERMFKETQHYEYLENRFYL
ncbi:MAG: hypothetical protein GY861_28710 [bacterium]|nr:hypothetical protein [bacterium]